MEEQDAGQLRHDWIHLEGGAGHQVYWGHLPHAGDDPSVLLEAGGVHGQEAAVCY